MKYYQLLDDVYLENRWFLGSPKDNNGKLIDPELFTTLKSQRIETALTIPVRQQGTSLDWTFADFDMPVINNKAFKILENFNKDSLFESFPAIIEGQNRDYVVINFLKTNKCVDEKKSEFIKWSEKDNRLDKIGQYRQISKLTIDSSQVQDVDVFRVEGWKIALIVSENIKNVFIKEKISGIKFLDVN